MLFYYAMRLWDNFNIIHLIVITDTLSLVEFAPSYSDATARDAVLNLDPKYKIILASSD
jgi:hypothetical protein